MKLYSLLLEPVHFLPPVFSRVEYEPPKLLWPGEVSDPRDEAEDFADSVDRLFTVKYCLRASESFAIKYDGSKKCPIYHFGIFMW